LTDDGSPDLRQTTSLAERTNSMSSAAAKMDTIGKTGFKPNANWDDWTSEPLMLPLDVLVARIRGEFREMTGLRLTFAQACRLWQVDAGTCDVALQTLLAERFLARTATGMFIALPTPRAAASLPLKVAHERSAAVPLQRQITRPLILRFAVCSLDARDRLAPRPPASPEAGPRPSRRVPPPPTVGRPAARPSEKTYW